MMSIHSLSVASGIGMAANGPSREVLKSIVESDLQVEVIMSKVAAAKAAAEAK